MSQIRFDNRVVIVTGAGNGLGREYALWFASKGAKVVVNDLGVTHAGEGTKTNPAQKVVDEIKAAGGVAVANLDSVEFGDKIVKTAIDAFGKVDVIINNAGILRDITFQKMTDLDWNLIMKVHVNGTYSVTRAAWDIMRQQGFGRIINTGSGSGIYGSFGQANYSTAKLGIHGLTLTLAKEGEKRNIRVNTIAPIAASRMTETVLPKEALANLDPKHIVPLVGYLAHESCEETGSLFEIAAGYIGKLRWQRSAGHMFDLPYTAEEVRDKWSTICDFEKNAEFPTATSDTFAKVNENVERIQLKKEEAAKKAAAATAAAPAAGNYKCDQIFTMMKVFLERGEGVKLVKDLQAVYGFNIVEKKNGPVKRAFTIDLKNGQGAVVFQEAKNADATFTMIDGDFEEVCLGKLNPNNAFMTGKMKIKGHMGKATKFTPALFPPPTPENIAKYTQAKL